MFLLAIPPFQHERHIWYQGPERFSPLFMEAIVPGILFACPGCATQGTIPALASASTMKKGRPVCTGTDPNRGSTLGDSGA